jgi:methyltransferase (TIGR00027 family)
MHKDDNTAVDNYLAELARGAALARALAAHDEREDIRGKDSLAELFLADEREGALQDPSIRQWLVKNYLPYGVYAYTIARTAYFDHLVEQALCDNLPQIVILGAGYDSRPYRFADRIKGSRIFELDDGQIRERKLQLLEKGGITVPAALSYADMSCEPSLLGKNLEAAGYEREKQTLFIWEGATYYLKSEAVERTIRFIGANAPAGSTLCFDYNTVSGESGADIGKDLAESMRAAHSEAEDLFVMDEWKAGVFMAERDFMIIEHLTSEEMEKRYLTLRDGSSAGKVPARHRIVYASLSK